MSENKKDVDEIKPIEDVKITLPEFVQEEIMNLALFSSHQLAILGRLRIVLLQGYSYQINKKKTM